MVLSDTVGMNLEFDAMEVRVEIGREILRLRHYSQDWRSIKTVKNVTNIDGNEGDGLIGIIYLLVYDIREDLGRCLHRCLEGCRYTYPSLVADGIGDVSSN